MYQSFNLWTKYEGCIWGDLLSEHNFRGQNYILPPWHVKPNPPPCSTITNTYFCATICRQPVEWIGYEPLVSPIPPRILAMNTAHLPHKNLGVTLTLASLPVTQSPKSAFQVTSNVKRVSFPRRVSIFSSPTALAQPGTGETKRAMPRIARGNTGQY